jgi:uncharacterized lipoprotein YddW (UPF0748 family)
MGDSRSSFAILLFVTGFSLFYFGCRTTKPIPVPVAESEVVPADTIPEPILDFAAEGIPSWIEPRKEFRAVWVATVSNIDWPSAPGLPVEQQKQELIDILNRAAALHFNAIILQVRPAADALYNSPYEPWSYYLTGKMGQAPLPAYDPLEFAVLEAHKRGLELHAWFNPFRALHPTNRSEISPGHISQTNPRYVHQYGDFLWMDPGLPEVREHTLNVILDVVERYDIDGVHFDDYFYPYPSYANGADFPDSLSWQRAVDAGTTLSRADWRRDNVNSLMKEISGRIKEIKPHVKFGISPFGIWRPGYPEHTTGFDAYEQLYADARLWLKEGWVDYFTPQLYYRMDQIPQPFPVMLQWWVEQNDHGRHMWPGLFTSRLRTTNITWLPEEITGQVYTSRGFPGVTGMVHFSMRTFMENSGNINRKLAAGPHSITSVIPPSQWLGYRYPQKPRVTVHDYTDYWTLHLQPGQSYDEVRWFIVRKKYDKRWETEVVPAARIETVYYGGDAMIRPEKIVVTAVNRIGLESTAGMTEFPSSEKTGDISNDVGAISIVARDEWANSPPSGLHANAVRRNILPGDTLRFRDLTIIYVDALHSSAPPDFIIDAVLPQEDIPDISVESTSANIRLYRNGVTETLSLQKMQSFNWYGFHIGILDISNENSLAQFEIATTTSLPVNRAAAQSTGNVSSRLRVPHRINRITLHHTGSAEPLTTSSDPVQLLRDLLQWGITDRNWWDVPYHYLIDLDGTIYEGRNPAYAGDTNTTYDPRGHLLISVMGNYTLQEPNGAQMNAIAGIMARAIKKYDLTLEDISSHQDWADTTCPGRYLIQLLEEGTLKSLIEEKLKEI